MILTDTCVHISYFLQLDRRTWRLPFWSCDQLALCGELCHLQLISCGSCLHSVAWLKSKDIEPYTTGEFVWKWWVDLVAGKAVAVATWRCHLLAALDKSLDCWCFNIASDPDFDLGVLTWNRLQAGGNMGQHSFHVRADSRDSVNSA